MAANGHKFPDGRLFGQIQKEQVFCIFRHTILRHEGNSKPGPGQVYQQAAVRKLDFRHEIQLVAAKQVMEGIAGGAFPAGGEDRVGQQFFQAYLTAF